MGTLNHFAKDAGVPLDLEAAAAAIALGDVRRVDVAEVNGHPFINNSSIGLYPRAVREREARPRRWASKRLAMVGAALRVLQSMPRHHVRLTVDGEPAVRTTSFVFVGNNTYRTGFGTLGQRGRVDGGTLSVFHVGRPDRRTVLALAARSLVGRLQESEQLEAREARQVVVEMRRPRVHVSLDGEVVRMRAPLTYTIRPKALPLLVPAAAAPAGAMAADSRVPRGPPDRGES
jgi:diacylglycerol kinase family enzyme